MERLIMNKMDSWFDISESLKKKGGRAGKQRKLGDGWNEQRWENWGVILEMLKWSDPLEEKHASWKEFNMATSMIKKD